ncbi:MAG: biotin carboxylase N-terminal domain-containing protein [Acidobacteriota bacterium]
MTRLLIANRGEIAVRIARAARALGVETVAVFADDDRDAPHTRATDQAVALRSSAALAYLDAEALLDAAQRSGATLVHPGYGFLAEDAAFARAVDDAGLRWVGPPAEVIDAMADKAAAKATMRTAGVPCLPDSGVLANDLEDAALRDRGDAVGWPLVVKAVAGGGGRGMRRVDSPDELADAVAAARTEAAAAFGDGRLMLERRLDGARHVEVQILADAAGTCLHLGTRDCSVQRRHQKLIEEAPAPALDERLRSRIHRAAVDAARAVGYVGAGTVELLVRSWRNDPTERALYFLEMNTRLQVEHGVTEAITGIDLVAWQLRIALGERLDLRQDDVRVDGHALEARLCLEDPAADFAPRAGRIALWRPPHGAGLRVDHALADGLEISPRYDSMVAKVIAHGPSRDAARRRLLAALGDTVLAGPVSNRAFLSAVLADDDFADAALDLGLAGRVAARFQSPRPDQLTRAAAAILLSEAWGDPSAPRWGWRSSPGWAGWPIELAATDDEELGGPWSLWLEPLATDTYRIRESRRQHEDERAAETESRSTDAIVVRIARAPDDEQIRLTLDTTEADATDRRRREARFTWRVDHRAPAPPGAAHGAVHLVGHDRERAAAWRFTLRPAAGRRAHDDTPAGSLVVRAPLAGRLSSLPVALGTEVAAGTTVAVVEAMKLEHRLAAPAAGRVAEIFAEVGSQVAHRQPILRLETGDDGS